MFLSGKMKPDNLEVSHTDMERTVKNNRNKRKLEKYLTPKMMNLCYWELFKEDANRKVKVQSILNLRTYHGIVKNS